MIETGCPAPLGARVVDDGVNFAVHSPAADRVELCLFDGDKRAASGTAICLRVDRGSSMATARTAHSRRNKAFASIPPNS